MHLQSDSIQPLCKHGWLWRGEVVTEEKNDYYLKEEEEKQGE